MKIAIIEDENITAKDLKKILLSIDSEIEVVVVLQSVEEAIEYLNNNADIDLIFSDIQLGDGLSFDIFEEIKNTTPIIFCTAYNEYALKAFSNFGIDYILKPFSTEAVTTSINKYLQFKGKFAKPKADYGNILNELREQLTPKSNNIIVKKGDKIIPIEIGNIALFYFENGYSFAYTFEGKTHILSKNLDELEDTFSPTFFRANRQHLINRKAVKDAAQHYNRKLVVNLSVHFKEEIIVGKLKITAFTNWLATS
ncbi:MAG: LytTR family DNA-binding domain-containing protein [Chitinophagaceae bacterium]|nr:LytTR family DNA-binding domain-containing protein [Chitinophagaceae bacterium]